MSNNVIRFPKVPRLLKPRGRKAKPEGAADHRFRDATKARLRGALRILLDIIDSLDGTPRRS